MPTRTSAIVGISLGSRYVGTAVVRGNELCDWRIKVIRARTEEERRARLRCVLEKLLSRYSPTHVAVKAIHPSRGSLALRRMDDHLRDLASENGLDVEAYDLNVLKGLVCKGGGMNKYGMSKALALMYPGLYQPLQRVERSKTAYYTRIFEAVAAALASRSVFRDN